MAKQVSPATERENRVANLWLLQRSGLTIKTPDDLSGLKNNDLVLYEGEMWIIVSFQKIKARMQQSEFASDSKCSHFWYLEIRR